MAMDYIADRTSSLRGNAEDAEALVYWLNTLPVPSALLVSELADLQDGRVIVDVVTHLFGSAGEEVLGMDLTQALERLDVLGGAPQQFPASSILAGQRLALLWVVRTLRGCAEAAASHSDSGGGNEVELEAVRAIVQLMADGNNDRAAAVRVEVGQRRGGSTRFEGSRDGGGGRLHCVDCETDPRGSRASGGRTSPSAPHRAHAAQTAAAAPAQRTEFSTADRSATGERPTPIDVHCAGTAGGRRRSHQREAAP
eukprot:SAG25_NODE_73_length_17157_cov_11.762575_16_plen_254_part_00